MLTSTAKLPPMSNNRGSVTCKGCHKKFSYQQWQEQKVCENPDCNCPSVRRSMMLTQQVITKMKGSSGKVENIINTTITPVPDGWADIADGDDVYQYACPPVMQIKVTPPGARGTMASSNNKRRGGK